MIPCTVAVTRIDKTNCFSKYVYKHFITSIQFEFCFDLKTVFTIFLNFAIAQYPKVRLDAGVHAEPLRSNGMPGRALPKGRAV